MDEVLAELKAVYNQYFPLWPIWSRYSDCRLPEGVLYFIQAQVNNNFVIDIDNVMFYNTLPNLKEVLRLLKADHKCFKNWLALQMAQALKALKLSQAVYAPLWVHWISSGNCTIKAEGITRINDLIQLRYKPHYASPTDAIKQLEEMQALALQLNAGYKTFQHWAVLKFRGCLFWRGVNYNLDTFFSAKVGTLVLTDELKACFLKFKIKNLAKLLALAPNKIIARPALFQLMMETQAILLTEEIAINKLKRKGGKKSIVLTCFNNLTINLN